jgi:uncharacterized protein
MKIVIAGSSGFIGSYLTSHFESQGHDLVHLSRHPDKPNARFWNPDKKEIDPQALQGADVVINLSGDSILGRWTPKKMEQIQSSRLASTRFLCETILSLPSQPKLYIGASAIGIYGDRPQEILDEQSPLGQGFLAEVCKQWEAIPATLVARGIRVAFTRFGIVLGKGGALKQMEKGFNIGMGGALGNGEQIMSWIAVDDICRIMDHIISHPELSGPINCVSPETVSNLTFTQTLGRVLNRPTMVNVPKFALTMLFGQGADVFLSSLNIKPSRLLTSGFTFQYPGLEEALKKYIKG